MEFGIGLMCYPGCWEDAAFAESHGFSTAGFVDSPLVSGAQFVCMALAAQATTTMRVGTFLNVPGLRSVPTTASALAAINAVAPGRVFLGTGTGYTGRITLGYRQPVAAAKVATYARQIRDMLEGRETTHRVGGRDLPIVSKYGADLGPAMANPIPIYVAADGPQILQAAGEVADGLITTLVASHVMLNGPQVFDANVKAFRAAAQASGRTLEDPYLIYSGVMCVLEPGEPATSPRALAMAGPQAMIAFHSYACHAGIADTFPPFLGEQIEVYEREVLARFDIPRERLYQEVHSGHLTRLLEGESKVLTEEIIRATTMTGTAEDIAANRKAMQDMGLKNATFWAPQGLARELVTTIKDQIVPLMEPEPATA